MLSSTWILTAVESNKESCGERVVLLITPWTNVKYRQLKPQENSSDISFRIWIFSLKKLYLMSAIFPRPYCVNSLCPSDVIWRQGSMSTLAQVMACCLKAPSHYLNQCWLIITEVQWHSFQAILQEMPQPTIAKIHLKMTYLKFHWNFPGDNESNNGSLMTPLNQRCGCTWGQ